MPSFQPFRQNVFLVLACSLMLPLTSWADIPFINIKLKDSFFQKCSFVATQSDDPCAATQSDDPCYRITLSDEKYQNKKPDRDEVNISGQPLTDADLFSVSWAQEMERIIEENSKLLWSVDESSDGLMRHQLSSYEKYRVPFFSIGSEGFTYDEPKVDLVAFYHRGNDRYCAEYHRERKQKQGKIVHEFFQILFHAKCTQPCPEPKIELICNERKSIAAKLKNAPLGEAVLKGLTGYNKEGLLEPYK